MPHNPTSPGHAERDAAARELRERAAALRQLAERGKDGGPLEHWALNRARQLEQVAEWMPRPFGHCDQCGMALEHFSSENVGAVLCPSCDGVAVAELVDTMLVCDSCAKPRPSASCHRRIARNGVESVLCSGCHDRWLCAVCSHSRVQHVTAEIARLPSCACECCRSQTFHEYDPAAADIAAAIASSLRARHG